MPLPKLKLCWNGTRVEADWHLGLLGFYARGGAGGRLRGVVVSGRGLLAWLAALAVVAYFTGAAALWFWLERRPYNQVAYADLVLPSRWSRVQGLRGQALVSEGLDDIQAHRWSAGLQKLRVGIARHPEEIKGRLVLADLFILMKARRQAVEVYDAGLAFGYPGRDYIEAMLKAAEQGEDYAWSLRTCDRALAMVAGDASRSEERRWLVRKKLSVLLAAERADEALALAVSEGETGSPAISEFRVIALLKEGRPAEALAFLAAWAGRNGNRPDPQVLRLQVRAFREAGDFAGMEQALESLRVLSPADPRPYAYGIVQRSLAGRRDDAARAMDAFLLRFGSTPQFLHLLAVPLAEIADRPLLEALAVYARQQGFPPEIFNRCQLQALIARAEWRDAAALAAEAQAGGFKNETESAWYGLMNAQIQAALDPSEGVQSNLVSLVREHPFTLGIYKELIANLRRAGRPATAREVVTFAQGVYPQNTVIETARTELDAELAAAAAAVVPVRPAVMASSPVESAPAREEWTETAFFARMDELAKAGDYEGALRHIRDMRRTKPAWLGGREAELDRAEVRFNGRAGDRLALRASVRLYITGDRLRSAQLIEIARDLHAAGCKDEAVLLLNELLAKVPDYAVARGLLAQWAPPAASPVR